MSDVEKPIAGQPRRPCDGRAVISGTVGPADSMRQVVEWGVHS